MGQQREETVFFLSFDRSLWCWDSVCGGLSGKLCEPFFFEAFFGKGINRAGMKNSFPDIPGFQRTEWIELCMQSVSGDK